MLDLKLPATMSKSRARTILSVPVCQWTTVDVVVMVVVVAVSESVQGLQHCMQSPPAAQPA